MTDYNKLIDNIKKALEKEDSAYFILTIDFMYSNNNMKILIDTKSISTATIERIEKENKLKFTGINRSFDTEGRVIRLEFENQ
jgi:frataxin-like iron-binding protein CyaY